MPPASYSECVWDHAPGWLLLTEAGGTVTDSEGKPLDFSLGPRLVGNRGVIGAASQALHAATLAAIKASRAAEAAAAASGGGGAH
jgi:3'(2'), 5'-bisphosphate nucleotidase